MLRTIAMTHNQKPTPGKYAKIIDHAGAKAVCVSQPNCLTLLPVSEDLGNGMSAIERYVSTHKVTDFLASPPGISDRATGSVVNR